MTQEESIDLKNLDKKGFVFIDEDSRPYWCRMYDTQPWFLFWNKAQKCWVTYRQVTQIEVLQAYQKAISEEQAEIYHELHRKFIEIMSLKPKDIQ